MKKFRVLFVCSGNTCRSPMAEAALQAAIEKEDDLKHRAEVSSAGLCAGREAMNEKSRAALEKEGIGYNRAFVSRPLTREMVEESDLIVAMTRTLKNELLSCMGEGNVRKIYAFFDLTGEDVPDPYGNGQAVYDACLKKIQEGVKKIITIMKTAR